MFCGGLAGAPYFGAALVSGGAAATRRQPYLPAASGAGNVRV